MLTYIKVKLVSPAIIGGSNSRKLDDPVILRPPEIRGQLRFWARALAGADNSSNSFIKEEEGLLLGNTEIGNKLIVFPPMMPAQETSVIELLPHKTEERLRSKTKMIIPNDELITLRFTIRQIEEKYIPKIKAVLWTWLNLGAIGKRSRRGFGSLLWIPESNDFLSDTFSFNPQTDLSSKGSFQSYLIRELQKVERIWMSPSSSRYRNISNNFYCFSSFDQVFVGEIFKDFSGNCLTLFNNDHDGIIARIHGINEYATGEGEELGHVRGRQSSPIMWRLFPCNDGYIPLMCWSPLRVTNITKGTDIYNYLTQRLGFAYSLMGKSL